MFDSARDGFETNFLGPRSRFDQPFDFCSTLYMFSVSRLKLGSATGSSATASKTLF